MRWTVAARRASGPSRASRRAALAREECGEGRGEGGRRAEVGAERVGEPVAPNFPRIDAETAPVPPDGGWEP